MSEETSIGTVLDAVKELTKQVASLTEEVQKLKEEWSKWRKAGKF